MAPDEEADDELLLASAALPLLLYWMAQRSPQQVIQLLATSKAMHEAIMQHSTGLLPVVLTPRSHKQIESFGAWLAKHAQLMASLRLCKLLKDSPDAAGVGMAEASRAVLEQAAEVKVAAVLRAHTQQRQHQHSPKALQQPRHGLSVWQFEEEFVGSAVGEILDALPSENMCSLLLGCRVVGLQSIASVPGASSGGGSSTSLAAFSRLKGLMLHVKSPQLQPLVASLPALTSLTGLSICSTFTTEQLATLQQHLPPQIIYLSLRPLEQGLRPPHSVLGGVQQPLQLRHLTRLTFLHA